MQITTKTGGKTLELQVTGRLDNQSAGDLTAAIDEALRMGNHAVSLDLSGTNYISSAGIGALVKAHKQFKAIRGYFGVMAISPEGAEVIRLTGLSTMLLTDLVRSRGSTNVSTSATIEPNFRLSVQTGFAYEIYDVHPQAKLSCEVIGNSAPIFQGKFQETHCQAVDFPMATLGIGLGAFGNNFADCANRFGEFMAVAGAAAQQPTSSSGKPDYQQVIGEFVPQVRMLYGLKCRGDFSQLIRFDSVAEDGRLALSSLADQFLRLTNTDLAALVILAESAGLIGTALRRSPATSSDCSAARFSHPEIRQWLSFNPDRAFVHTQTLVVGVVSRGALIGEQLPLASLLRPLSPGSEMQGHFHASVFTYRPFKKRKLELNETVSALFETEDLQAVLHLLHDDRETAGSGESEFVRGACWVGPIDQVLQQGTQA